jgi:hypothetical protein
MPEMLRDYALDSCRRLGCVSDPHSLFNSTREIGGANGFRQVIDRIGAECLPGILIVGGRNTTAGGFCNLASKLKPLKPGM